MKHLKIKLSVLALACLGAGALALQPTANVQAQAAPEDCLTMVHGAAVYVSPEDAEKPFNGIRWTTKIDATKYTEGEFGTLVLPTSMLGEDGVLTHDDADVLDLPANVDYANLPEVFYSIVSYDALGANASAAYAMELTARSYVKIGDDYYYASLEGVNTSRSARQVALATELAGEFEDDTYKANKAAKYYGKTERYVPAVVSNGAPGTVTVSLEVVATTAQKKLTFNNINDENENYTTADIAEVVIGAERIANADDQAKQTEYAIGSSNNFAFYVRQGEFLPVGEQYVTVFFTDGKFKTFPIVCATKIITKATDLAMFSAKGGYGVYSTKATEWVDDKGTEDNTSDDVNYWRPEQEQSGYYVLGKDIDASKYVHGSKYASAEDLAKYAPDLVWGADKTLGTEDDVALAGTFNNASWNGVTQYKNKPIGLTGTFNGMGYKISEMTIGSEREGLFGIVNGGEVKNVAFIDVQATGSQKFTVANYLYKANVENVYIRTDKYATKKVDMTDENGNVIYEDVVDADGNKVQDTDAEGNPLFDAEGNPVYKQQAVKTTVVSSMGFPMEGCAALAHYAAGNTTLKSLFIHYQKANNSGYTTGVMFNGYNKSFTAEDVYCVTDNKIGDSGYTHALMYINTKSFDISDKENYNDTKRVWLAENEQQLECTDGTILKFAPGEVTGLNDDGTPIYADVAPADNRGKKTLVNSDLDLKFHNDKTRPRVVMMGAYRYNSLTIMYKYNTTYTNLANTGCWYLDADNKLVWGQQS